MKTCCRCNTIKELNLFSKKKASSDGLKSHCKECDKVDRIKNVERDRSIKKEWIKNNLEKHRLATTKYNLENREAISLYKRKYRQKYEANKLKNDIQHRLRNRLRARLHSIMISSGDTREFLGCSLEEFKLHIESLWQPGMTWKNWSKYGWHIDHILPLKSFDLTDKNQLKVACNFTNMQPLWWRDNLKKSSKV